jgi:hypothetical protein
VYVVGTLHTFYYGLWYRGRDVLCGLSKYETNSIRLVMVIQFVNFVHYFKNPFKIINSEIIRIFGFSDQVELDDYRVHTTQWHLTKPQGADINKGRRTKIWSSELNLSDDMMDELRRECVYSAVHTLRSAYIRINHIAMSINIAYQVPILFEVMAVLTTISLKFHLGLVTIFFENVTDSAVTLFLRNSGGLYCTHQSWSSWWAPASMRVANLLAQR